MNAPDNTWGLPRELIPWGPTIEPARCRGSGECVRFCPNNVYEFDAAEGRARVAHFHQCMVLCSNCVAVCPNGAISFPGQDEFLDRVQELRRQQSNPPLHHPEHAELDGDPRPPVFGSFDTIDERDAGRVHNAC